MKIFHKMTSGRLEEIIAGFARARIAVIGDFFLDKYLDVDPRLAEISLETGKTCHQVVRIRHSPGAAGTVVSNLAALGAGEIFAIGFTGDDGEAYDLRKDLAAMRCDTSHLLRDPSRVTPTYLKPRDETDPSLAGEHNRYDTKNRVVTTVAVQERLIASLDALLPQVDAVIAADQVEEQDCGVITSRVVETLAERGRRFAGRVVFWADSRRRIRQFRNVIIKPNQFEAVSWENPPPDACVPVDQLVEAIQRLRVAVAAPIVITRGAAGMLVSDPEPILTPGVRVEGPIDPTGAGDSATAGAVLALAAGASLPEAAVVGNLVASITVQQLATTGVARPEQLRPRLDLWRSQVATESAASDTAR